MSRRWIALPLLLTMLPIAGCMGHARSIPGTKIQDTDVNRAIIGTVERYRLAVEAKDTARLLALASRNYWENAGTPSGADDYGYDGLREMLTTRFQRVEKIRYSMKYVEVKRQDARAFVDVVIDASYSIPASKGSERRDMKDQNRFVLEQEGDHWLFLSGM